MADDNIISIVSVVDEPSEDQRTQVDVSSTSRSERRQNHNARRNANKQVVLIDVEKGMSGFRSFVFDFFA